MRIITIGSEDLALLERFVAALGTSAASFRYFLHRPVTVIANHLCTLLLLDDCGTPVGYGHLDPDGGRVWLGVALAEGATGHGYGKQLMYSLLTVAREKRLSEVYLAVDNDNLRARSLYEKCGFIPVESRATLTIFRWTPESK